MSFWRNMLFPHFCLHCDREGDLLCGHCQEVYQPRIPKPSCPFCQSSGSDRVCAECLKTTSLDGLSTIASYADPCVREAIHLWKYHGDETAFEVLQRWISSQAIRLHIPLSCSSIVPIPLHKRRKRFRGFDQAQVLSKAFSRSFGLTHYECLERRYMTAPQAVRHHKVRAVDDLEGIFEVKGEVPPAVLLCDDVFTSGATMNAAAQCLKNHGAKEVWGLVLAKGT